MTETDRQYPPAEWTVDDVFDALAEAERDGTADGDLSTYDDASRWDAIADDPATAAFVEEILERADRIAGDSDSIPQLPASLYADYVRTGNRSRYQRAYFERHQRLALLTLAACLEHDGRYLDDVLDHVWAICEQTTWLLPAHLPEDERRDGLPMLHPPNDHYVALFSARTAHLLAEVDYLLGERLHPALRARIRSEVDERVLTPFEERKDFHWRQPPTGNWNAVCHAGAVIAALYVETDRERLANLITKATDALEHYLESFGLDGCTSEGLAYWNFGFGHYVMLSSTLQARTGGRMSLLTPPICREIARFPLEISLSPGRFVPFSDSRETDDVDPYLACRLGEEFDLPALVAEGHRALRSIDGPFSQRSSDNLMEAVRTLHWCHDASSDFGVATPSQRTYFSDCEWWLSRADPLDPDGLVVAAKGGHNDEYHNHNDCGSVVVHYRGESSITDLGSGTYDRDYFSDRRYEYLTTRSLGHSVPYVNGHEQAVGETYAATVIDRSCDHDRDRFEIELSDCYPDAAGVTTLRRSITLERAAERVTIADAATFDVRTDDPELEYVFVSCYPIEAVEPTKEDENGNGAELVIEGDRSQTRLAFEPTPNRTDVKRFPDAIDFSGDDTEFDARDVWRARVVPPVDRSEREGKDSAGTKSCQLQTTIVPKDAS